MAYAPPGPPLVKAAFKVQCDGLPDGWCTKAKIPRGKPKLTKVQAAGNAQETKFPSGLQELDDLELGFILGADGALAAWIEAWRAQHAEGETGQTGVAPEAVKRTVTIQQLDTDGATVVHEWEALGCLLMDPGPIDLEAGKEDAVTIDVKLSVDRVEKIA